MCELCNYNNKWYNKPLHKQPTFALSVLPVQTLSLYLEISAA